VYVLIDTFRTAFFRHQIPPIKSILAVRKVVKNLSKFGLPKKKEVPHLDYVVQTYHLHALGVLHSKMIIIDNKRVIMGSKNMDADTSMEYMYVMEGQVADAMRHDFQQMWGPRLPEMPVAVPNPKLDIPVLVVSQKETPFIVSHSENSPQDIAFMAALDVAQHEVYIQSPDVCTIRIAEAIVDAVKRGVHVTVVTSYRQQDRGEQIQKYSIGSNYETGAWIKKQLESSDKAGNFKFCWYIGTRVDKDIKPKPEEWSHVKAMVVDNEFAIAGSGNQDPNSWYHSRECNLLFDDPTTAQDIYRELQRQQHSLKHCFSNK